MFNSNEIIMKKTILLLLVLLLTYIAGYTQMSVLFVNDNAAIPGNTSLVLSALNETGYEYNVFDAVEFMASPTFEDMLPYDLVIWYTSTDGVSLYFWNGGDTDNQALISYLQNGGMLWVIGVDFLYDRYITPTNFSSGEFVYDYLGVSQYYAQAYGDDGGVGVPQLDLVSGQEITTLDPVIWSFPTAWWVDACLPVNDAIPVYRMGPDDYVFSDYFSGIYFSNADYHTLAFFFDLALMDSDQNRITLFNDVLGYFDSLVVTGISKNESRSSKQIELICNPNPAKGQTHAIIKIFQPVEGNFSIELIDLFGKTYGVLGNYTNMFENMNVKLNLSAVEPGFYQVVIKSNNKILTSEKLIVQ